MFGKMFGTILKSVFTKPATILYPHVPAKTFQKTRGRITIDIAACIFCGMCQRKCPAHAIRVDRQEKKWEIDPLRCLWCSACVEACPKKCLAQENAYSPCQIDRRTEVYTQAVPGSSAQSSGDTKL